MRVSDIAIPNDVDGDRLTRLEERVARLEALQGSVNPPVTDTATPPAALSPVFTGKTPATKEEFEFELGEHWFARAGVISMTAGVLFLLSLPHRSLPAAVPAIFGFFMVATLLGAE